MADVIYSNEFLLNDYYCWAIIEGLERQDSALYFHINDLIRLDAVKIKHKTHFEHYRYIRLKNKLQWDISHWI